MKSFYPLVFFLVFVVLVEAFFFGFLAISYTRRAEDFRIREDFVSSAILQGVSNYLASVAGTSSNTPSRSASFPFTPSVVFVDLSTWVTPKGGYSCSINGNRYKQGDFTEYGLIFRISDGRVFCRAGDDVRILRRSPPSGEARQRLPQGGGGEGSDSAL